MSLDRQMSPLETRAFHPLPLGSIYPDGWLQRQLEIQARGLTGNLDEIWPDIQDNAWLGGERDGWERGPYYADGLVPLAHVLNDSALEEKAHHWVNGFLSSQTDEGWFEPRQVWEAVNPEDPWPRFVICKVLRQHWEATGDDRALDALEAFGRYMLEHPDEWSIEDWAEMRWMELAVVLHWLAEELEEAWPLELVSLLHGRGFDWIDHFQDFEYVRKHRDEPIMQTHVVNNAMGVKAPGVMFRQTGNERGREAVYEGMENLDRFHGQVTGLFTGDEHFSGKFPSQGTELCAVVEYMYSLRYLASTLGRVEVLDRLERITYNALPATFTPDMWAHQYDQQVNQVLCTVGERDWTNGPEANIFGQGPHFGCCHANFHQGWPKFVGALWMQPDDGGIAALAYGPSEVSVPVDSTNVCLHQRTDYPFDDRVRIHIETDEPAAFPLDLRIPAWTQEARVKTPGRSVERPEPGQYHRLERTWEDGDVVELEITPRLEVYRGYHGSVAIRRGPIVFSLPVPAEHRRLSGDPPVADWELYPTEPWNYGLALDLSDPDASTELSTEPPGDTPFAPEDPPMRLSVEGAIVPQWELSDGWADQVPGSPVRTDEPLESLELVPYGATMLRVTEFPLIETA